MESQLYVNDIQGLFSPSDMNRSTADKGLQQRRIGVILRNGFSFSDLETIQRVFQLANEVGGATRPCQYVLCLLSVYGRLTVSSSSVCIPTLAIEGRSFIDNLDTLFFNNSAQSWGICQTGWIADTVDGIPFLPSQKASTASVTRKGGSDSQANRAVPYDRYKRPLYPQSTPDSGPDRRNLSLLKTALLVVQSELGKAAMADISRALLSPNDISSDAEEDLVSLEKVTNRIRGSVKWLQDNSTRNITIGDAASAASMSERNFLRRFKREMGLAPSKFLQQLRLDMVCRLLAESDLPIDKVARRCGIDGGERIAKIFRKRLNISPTEYRQIHTKTDVPHV